MPLQLPTPDDYAGTTDVEKIVAALADPAAPEIYFQRMYNKLAGDPVIVLPVGKSLRGPGKFRGCGITSAVAGNLLSAAWGTAGGGGIYGLDLIGDVDGAAIVNSGSEEFDVWDCLLRGWRFGAIQQSGTTAMHCRYFRNRVSGNANAASGAAGIYIMGGTTTHTVGNAYAAYPTLLRTKADGHVSERESFEAGSGDAVYIEGGNAVVENGWFDQGSIVGHSLNVVGGSDVRATGNRGVTAAKVSVAPGSTLAIAYF